jgi:hypothetical protein
MRPITYKMQQILNTALVERDGVVHASYPQARGLIERGLATGHSRDTVRGGMFVLIKASGYALADRGAYYQQIRNQEHIKAEEYTEGTKGD